MLCVCVARFLRVTDQVYKFKSIKNKEDKTTDHKHAQKIGKIKEELEWLKKFENSDATSTMICPWIMHDYKW